MSDPNKEFADAVVGQESGAPSDEGGHEPSEADPLAEYAKALKAMGVTPESAREAHERIAFYQTPEGQSQWFENFLSSPQGASLKEQFGRDYTAKMLAENPERMVQMAQEFGYKPPAQASDDDELTETREMRAIKAQQSALEARMKQLAEGAQAEIGSLKAKLQGQDELKTRVEAFQEWRRTVPPMAEPAIKAVAKRAHELAILYPDQYRGSIGFKSAARDAHAEFSSQAKYFMPKPGPRSSAGGGGIAGKSQDTSKMTLAQQIEAAAEQFALDARGERGGD